MAALREGQLEVDVPAAVSALKFDDASTHGFSHCMKSVDFIFELHDRWLFVELKDPDGAPPQFPAAAKFLADLGQGKLDEDFVRKFRDTFLYRWAEGVPDKPVQYLVLVAAAGLTDADLMARTDALKRKLPVGRGRSGRWQREVAQGALVLNLSAWQKHVTFATARRV